MSVHYPTHTVEWYDGLKISRICKWCGQMICPDCGGPQNTAEFLHFPSCKQLLYGPAGTTIPIGEPLPIAPMFGSREWWRYEFAGRAMQGSVTVCGSSEPSDFARWAVQHADALIAELDRKESAK